MKTPSFLSFVIRVFSVINFILTRRCGYISINTFQVRRIRKKKKKIAAGDHLVGHRPKWGWSRNLDVLVQALSLIESGRQWPSLTISQSRKRGERSAAIRRRTEWRVRFPKPAYYWLTSVEIVRRKFTWQIHLKRGRVGVIRTIASVHLIVRS